jgi:hypothetical protein
MALLDLFPPYNYSYYQKQMEELSMPKHFFSNWIPENSQNLVFMNGVFAFLWKVVLPRREYLKITAYTRKF